MTTIGPEEHAVRSRYFIAQYGAGALPSFGGRHNRIGVPRSLFTAALHTHRLVPSESSGQSESAAHSPMHFPDPLAQVTVGMHQP